MYFGALSRYRKGWVISFKKLADQFILLFDQAKNKKVDEHIDIQQQCQNSTTCPNDTIHTKDTNFVEFLESNRDLPRATSTSALSSASVFRFIGKMGDTVTKITYKMEETDPWYEDKIVQLEALEAQLKKLYTLGAFTNYVDKSLPNIDHPLHSVDISSTVCFIIL